MATKQPDTRRREVIVLKAFIGPGNREYRKGERVILSNQAAHAKVRQGKAKYAPEPPPKPKASAPKQPGGDKVQRPGQAKPGPSKGPAKRPGQDKVQRPGGDKVQRPGETKGAADDMKLGMPLEHFIEWATAEGQYDAAAAYALRSGAKATPRSREALIESYKAAISE